MSSALFFFGSLLFPIFHLLTVHRFIRSFFPAPRRAPVRCGAWAVYYVLLTAVHLWGNIPPPILLALNTGLLFMIVTLSAYSDWKYRCLFSLLLVAVWMLAEIMVSLPLSLLGMEGQGLTLAGAAISNTLMFAVAVMAGHYVKGEEHADLSIPYTAAMILIPSGTIYLMNRIFYIAMERTEYSGFAICSSFVLLMMNYMAFSLYEWMAKEAGAQKRSLLYKQELELLSRQIEKSNACDKQIRRLRHDMNNHMTGLLGMIEEGSREQAGEYLRFLLKDSMEGRTQDAVHSGNPAVDAIVNDKYSQAQKEGIAFEANVFIPSDLPFQAGDLAIVFGNLLDNALEACRDPETEKPWISLEASYRKEVLMVTVNNSCTMRKKDGKGRFSTTKKDRKNHGLGLLSVEQAVESYQGQLAVECQDGIFQSIAVMYGNMGEV